MRSRSQESGLAASLRQPSFGPRDIAIDQPETDTCTKGPTARLLGWRLMDSMTETTREVVTQVRGLILCSVFTVFGYDKGIEI